MMMKIMGIVTPSCDEVSCLSSLSLDEKLPFTKRIGMKVHISFCNWCRNFRKQIETISRISKEDHSENIDTKLSDQTRSRLQKTIEENL